VAGIRDTVTERNRKAEAFATIRGALRISALYSSLFLVLGTICLSQILAGNGGELFKLGNTPIPKLLGAGATYNLMFLTSLAGVSVVLVAVLLRYFYYREYIEELRNKGVTDLDGDGNIDTFADTFLDEDL